MFTFLIVIFVYINYLSNVVMPWQKEEIINTTLSWSGLNKFPEKAKIIDIQKKGSLFSRQFVNEFNVQKKEIQILLIID